MFYFEALCSLLVVGLGQILKGESKKGLIFLLIFYFALPAAVYLALLISGRLFLWVLGTACISGIILWVYSVGDALLKS